MAFLQRLQATREGQQDAQGTSPRPTATPAPTVGFGAMDRWGGDADSRAGDSKGMIRGPPAVRTRPHSAAVPASPTMGAMGGAWGLAGVREGPSSPARVRPGDGALLPFDLGNGVMGADGESIAKLRQFADTQVRHESWGALRWHSGGRVCQAGPRIIPASCSRRSQMILME